MIDGVRDKAKDSLNQAPEATENIPTEEDIQRARAFRQYRVKWGKSHKWIRVIIQTLTVICVIIGWISAIMFTGISNKLIDNQAAVASSGEPTPPGGPTPPPPPPGRGPPPPPLLVANTCVSPCTLADLAPGYEDVMKNTKQKCIEKSFENLISWVKTAAICTIIASGLQFIFLAFSEYPINQQSLTTLILYFLGWIVLIINIVVSSQLLGVFGRSIPAVIGVDSKRCFILYSKDNLELSLKYYQWSIFFTGATLMGMVFNESYGMQDFKDIYFSKFSK
jgi:hypothetical protein